MRELAVQSANDSVSDTERGYLNTEFTDLISEMDRIASVVEYNGIQLDGTAGSTASWSPVGTRDSANDRIDISRTLRTRRPSASTVTRSRLRLTLRARSPIDSALEILSTDRATIDSAINTLNVAVDGLASSIENYGTAMSQIKDTDMADESSAFSKSTCSSRRVWPC